jgi:hypothetical protein
MRAGREKRLPKVPDLKLMPPKAPVAIDEQRYSRSMEIEAIVRFGRDLSDQTPAHPCSVTLHVALSLLEGLAKERGLLPVDRDVEAALAPSRPEPASETGSPIERFTDSISATTDRFLAEGIYPPNLAAALRAEADRVQAKEKG